MVYYAVSYVNPTENYKFSKWVRKNCDVHISYLFGVCIATTYAVFSKYVKHQKIYLIRTN